MVYINFFAFLVQPVVNYFRYVIYSYNTQYGGRLHIKYEYLTKIQILTVPTQPQLMI